ncbi:GAF and ANTAR domain-containing protein [Streptomyces purpurogeneiscleroticus]|uniref:GAF and ANTAR domain-containing protein n=1 Tax=Streptomyces purpurogeneiscleroticus TaxID=68259 RepID=UPI001CBD2167|nr:GAF and ANTAR domain-containing protein [Streptomyces purpurogeneiscleroticus]
MAVLVAMLTAGGGLAEVSEHCQRVVPDIDAVGLTVAIHPTAGARLTVSTHGWLAEPGEALQFDLGEGPCIETHVERRPVLVEDLGADGPAQHWPVFAGQAWEAGIRAVFTFPVLLHEQVVAVLSLYRSAAGALSMTGERMAAAYAAAAAVLLLHDAHTLITSDQGEEEVALIPPPLAVISQAVGFLVSRLDLNADQALARLRAHAFVEQRPLAEVADDLLKRRLPVEELP